MNDHCEMCGKPENFPEDTKSELRPYGPGGSAICFRCAFSDDASAEQAKANFLALSDATHAIGEPVVIATCTPTLGHRCGNCHRCS